MEVDLIQDDYGFNHHLGIEIGMNEWLDLRAGFINSNQLTAGFGVEKARFLVNYAVDVHEDMLSSHRERIGFMRHSLRLTINRQIQQKQMNTALFRERIRDLSPLSVLKRGYSITRTLPGKTIIKHASKVDKGEFVNIILAEGELDCRVEKTIPAVKTHLD